MSSRGTLRGRFRKVVAIAPLVAALASALVVGCRRSPRAPAQDADAVLPPTGALRLVTVENGAHREALEGVLADFVRSHPGAPIVHESVAGGGFSLLADKVRTSYATGSPPDFFQMWPGEILGPFVDAGYLRPLDDLYAQAGWESVLPAWTVRGGSRYGRRFGVPTCSHGITFWYRKDVFARYGLAPPESYAELEGICRTLRAHDVHCLSLGGKYGWSTMRLLDFFLEKTCGPELHDRINALEERWDRPEVIEAYRLLRRWVDEKWLAPGFLSVPPDDARLPFYRGDAAMVFEGDWLETQMTQEDEQAIENFDFFVPPTDRQPRRVSAYAEFFVVARESKHVPRLAQLFDWMLKPDVQARMLREISWAATKGVQTDRKLQPRMAKWRAVLDSHETFRPTDQEFPKQVMDEWWAVQDAVVAGELSPEQGARGVQKVMEAYTARRKLQTPAAFAILGIAPGTSRTAPLLPLSPPPASAPR